MSFHQMASRIANQDETPVPEPMRGTMTVGNLITFLQKEDASAPVGVSASWTHGWVQEIKGLAKTPDGIVCIDQGDASIVDDEVDISPV